MRLELTERHALVTAEAWIAAARYRTDSLLYFEYRDSLLARSEISLVDLDEYFDLYRDEPEEYFVFTSLVQIYVDSLAKEADWIRDHDSTLGVKPDSSAVNPRPIH